MQLFWTGQGCVLYVFISNCSGAARQGVYAWRGGGRVKYEGGMEDTVHQHVHTPYSCCVY